MALIKCSECSKEISDKATSCPSCGNPIRQNAVVVDGTVEIERTNKKWKKKSLWGAFFVFLGLFLMSKNLGLGILVMIFGFGKLMFSSFGAWWTNG